MGNIFFDLQVLGIFLFSVMCIRLLVQLGSSGKKKKWETDYYAKDPAHMKRLKEEKNKPQKPKVFRGKRGGKYTKGKTKEGGSYRRYF
tara:strand:+ start:117 stop:380 length:264 start_codon:yes stop_codon:yes gene_type:complete